MICFFEAILYNHSMKLALVSSFLVVMFMGLTVKSFRKYYIQIFAVFVFLNFMGWLGSKTIQAPHKKATDEVMSKIIKKLPVKSRFEAGSIRQRVYIWEQTLSRIMDHPFVGRGPGSITKDLTLYFPHGHNLFLTFGANYGVVAALLVFSALFFVLQKTCRGIFSKNRSCGKSWFLQLTLFAATNCALFEYFFDCEIWSPHLWVMLGLLLASTRLENYAVKDRTGLNSFQEV